VLVSSTNVRLTAALARVRRLLRICGFRAFSVREYAVEAQRRGLGVQYCHY
jgi:hypothetical protein